MIKFVFYYSKKWTTWTKRTKCKSFLKIKLSQCSHMHQTRKILICLQSDNVLIRSNQLSLINQLH